MNRKKKDNSGDLVKTDGSKKHPFVQYLRGYLDKNVVNQERAKDFAVKSYEKTLGLSHERRPLGVAMFLGPSGVGKTETAKVLAECLFHCEDAFTKINCSEYKEPHSISTLLGSPPGYVGSADRERNIRGHQSPLEQEKIDAYAYRMTEKGQKSVAAFGEKAPLEKELNEKTEELKMLSEKLKLIAASRYDKIKEINERITQLKKDIPVLESRIAEFEKIMEENQYDPEDGYISVILFDEIEKAHKDLHNLLLQIMDEGEIVLRNGEITSFRSSIIILTSNVGKEEIEKLIKGQQMGFAGQKQDIISTEDEELNSKIYEIAIEAAKKVFSAEFRGRLDNMVVFRYLTKEHIKQILDIEIRKFQENLLHNIGFPTILHVSDEVKDFIVSESGDRIEYGARLLRNKFEKYVVSEIGQRISTDEIQVGDEIFVELIAQSSEKEKPYVEFFYSKKAREEWQSNQTGIEAKLLATLKKYMEFMEKEENKKRDK